MKQTPNLPLDRPSLCIVAAISCRRTTPSGASLAPRDDRNDTPLDRTVSPSTKASLKFCRGFPVCVPPSLLRPVPFKKRRISVLTDAVVYLWPFRVESRALPFGSASTRRSYIGDAERNRQRCCSPKGGEHSCCARLLFWCSENHVTEHTTANSRDVGKHQRAG